MAGAESQRRLDLDADTIEGDAGAVMGPVHDEAAGNDGSQSGEAFAHPIFCRDTLEVQRFGRGVPCRRRDQSMNYLLIGCGTKMHRHAPAAGADIHKADGNFVGGKSLGGEIGDPMSRLFIGFEPGNGGRCVRRRARNHCIIGIFRILPAIHKPGRNLYMGVLLAKLFTASYTFIPRLCQIIPQASPQQADAVSSAIEPGGPNQMMDRRAVVGGLAAGVLAPSAFAAAADDWPERPVRIVVPFSAGGAADTFGRFYADALSAAFGKQFYVENKVGAGGMIGTEEGARAKPDGYTLVVSGIPTHVLGPAMNKNVSFDPMRDFTHIAFFGGAPNAFVVHPDFGVRSFADFMARAKSESGGIEYVSAGVGTVGNWVAEYLAAKTGIKLVHVAYKGGANAVLDLIAGHVKVGMLTYSSVSG